MAEPLHEAGEPPCVEMFGVLELVLSSSNAIGYKDVYKQKGRKKRPFQAKIYRTLRKDFYQSWQICHGTHGSGGGGTGTIGWHRGLTKPG